MKSATLRILRRRLTALTALTVSLCWLPTGCRSQDGTPVPIPEVTSELAERGRSLSDAMASAPVRGTVLHPRQWLLYRTRPTELAERAAALGLNRLYFVAPPETISDLDSASGELLGDLAKAAKDASVECEIMLLQRDYVPRRFGTVLQRKFSEPRPLHAAALKLAGFLAGRGSAFSGVTVSSEVHMFTLASPELPSNAIYLWSDRAYGVGRDNDILIRQLLVDLADFRQTLGTFCSRFTVAVPDFYHDRTEDGDLSCGSVGDFLKVADAVMVIGSGNRPTECLESVMSEMSARDVRPGSLLMGIFLAEHSSDNRAALRRRDWADFVKIVAFLREHVQEKQAFAGMVIAPWNNLELLWLR